MVKKRNFDFITEGLAVIYQKMFPIYIIIGEKNIMIDSALTANARDIHEKIEELFTQDREWKSKKIDTILLTHSHYDHTGGCSYFQEVYGSHIEASALTANLLKKDKVIGFIESLNREYESLHEIPSGIKFERLAPMGELKEGDRIEIAAGRYLEVYETPGHTRCSISFMLMPDKVLFPGDSLGIIADKAGIRPLFLSSYTAYEASIKKLQKLDVEILALSHNKFIKGKDKVTRHMMKALAGADAFKKDILSRLAKTTDYREIAEDFLTHTLALPTAVMGPKEAVMINLTAMIKAVHKEFMGG